MEENQVDGKTIIELSDEDFIRELELKPLQLRRLRKEFEPFLEERNKEAGPQEGRRVSSPFILPLD